MSTRNNHRKPTALTIAGSDSGAGAGIQADLRVFAAYGLHGVSAITAVTAQNSRGVAASHTLSAAHLRNQLLALFADFDIRAIKIGMLGSAANVATVAELLKSCKAQNVVLDPVLASSSGTPLLSPRGTTCLRRDLLPLVHVLTPNIPEAAVLLKRQLSDGHAMRHAAGALRELGPQAVLLKGGHGDGQTIVDYLADADGIVTYRHRRRPFVAHGTGCALSSAIAAGLARGWSLRSSVQAAERMLQQALRSSYRSGRGPARTLAISPLHVR